MPQTFTNTGLLRVAFVLRGLLLLMLLHSAGCQFVPQQDADSAAETTGTTAEGQAPMLTPNPYLAERPAVPADARRRYAAAQEAMQAQQWAAAETDLLWIIQNYPQFSGPFLALAMVYQETEKSAEAEQAFRQALATNPSNIGAYNQFGIFLREAGRFQEAEEVYRQALAVWPDSADTHLNLGILYDLYMGRLPEALEHYRRFQALQPEPDRRVEGWIVDTERRLEQAGQPGGGV